MSKKQTDTFTLVHPVAAGIDVGASCHYVCAGSPGNTTVRRFGTFTEDLFAPVGRRLGREDRVLRLRPFML